MRTRARAAWCAVITALAIGISTSVGVGIWQAVRILAMANVDPGAARQTVVDVVNSAVPKLLNYTPDNVESDLNAAKSLLTGEFKDSYSNHVDNTVIPDAKERRITSTASVAAAAVESLTTETASAIAFVNQTVTTPPAAPTFTASSIRVGLRKVNGAWLIEEFEPI